MSLLNKIPQHRKKSHKKWDFWMKLTEKMENSSLFWRFLKQFVKICGISGKIENFPFFMGLFDSKNPIKKWDYLSLEEKCWIKILGLW